MERRIDLDGCVNFRDLGGYPTRMGARVRWRTLYRSDALGRMSAADVERVTGELGVSDVIDLRTSHELELDGRGPLEHAPVGFHHLPLFDGDPSGAEARAAERRLSLGDRYVGMLERAQSRIAAVLDTMAGASGGVVYHCAAGKDRTGVISALVLSLAGVADEVIAADYGLSQERMDAIIDKLANSKSYERVLDELPKDTLHARPESMLQVMGALTERWGGARGYAEAIGLPAARVDALVGRIVEPG